MFCFVLVFHIKKTVKILKVVVVTSKSGKVRHFQGTVDTRLEYSLQQFSSLNYRNMAHSMSWNWTIKVYLTGTCFRVPIGGTGKALWVLHEHTMIYRGKRVSGDLGEHVSIFSICKCLPQCERAVPWRGFKHSTALWHWIQKSEACTHLSTDTFPVWFPEAPPIISFSNPYTVNPFSIWGHM